MNRKNMRGRQISTNHRFNVNFSDPAYKILTSLAARKEKSLSDTLRDALALEKWFQDSVDKGNKILVEDSRGKVREVILR
jgi:hypothetical protein